MGADVRSLVQYNHGFACMSTNSKSNTGFPGGSVVGFAVDDDGSPVFVFSGMSSHGQDILKDPRCSLTVADKNFKGAADGRVNLMGTCHRIKEDNDEIDKIRQISCQASWRILGRIRRFLLLSNANHRYSIRRR